MPKIDTIFSPSLNILLFKVHLEGCVNDPIFVHDQTQKCSIYPWVMKNLNTNFMHQVFNHKVYIGCWSIESIINNWPLVKQLLRLVINCCSMMELFTLTLPKSRGPYTTFGIVEKPTTKCCPHLLFCNF